MKFALFLGCNIPSRVSQYETSARAVLQRLEDVERVDAARAGHPDDTNRRRVLDAGYAGKVRAGIRAPVAQKADDFGFKGVC